MSWYHCFINRESKWRAKGIFGPRGSSLTLTIGPDDMHVTGTTDFIKMTGIYTQKKLSKEILDKDKILDWWENLKHR